MRTEAHRREEVEASPGLEEDSWATAAKQAGRTAARQGSRSASGPLPARLAAVSAGLCHIDRGTA